MEKRCFSITNCDCIITNDDRTMKNTDYNINKRYFNNQTDGFDQKLENLVSNMVI